MAAWQIPGQIEVGEQKPELAEELKTWYRPSLIEVVKNEETALLTTKKVRRRIFSPMLDRKGGIISHYDGYFQTYCRDVRWDWRLMAAQCYQESTFDPQAVSFAGAKGLMQIMPGTADHLGVSRSKLYDPETNIAAAAKLIKELQQAFSDIGDNYERTNFVLASYNGGSFHIRDAMALGSMVTCEAQRPSIMSVRSVNVMPAIKASSHLTWDSIPHSLARATVVRTSMT